MDVAIIVRSGSGFYENRIQVYEELLRNTRIYGGRAKPGGPVTRDCGGSRGVKYGVE